MEELLARPDNSYKACRSQENKLHRGLEKQKTADELFARPTTVSIGDCPSFRFRFKAGHRPWSAPNTYRGSVVRLNEGAPFQRVTSPEEPASGRPRNSFSSLLPSYSKVGLNPERVVSLSPGSGEGQSQANTFSASDVVGAQAGVESRGGDQGCLLYTSDAADE